MKDGKDYDRNKTGKNFTTAFQLFKTLKCDIDKLTTPILLTDEPMSTQFYDNVEEYRTLDYTNKSYRQEEFKEKPNSS